MQFEIARTHIGGESQKDGPFILVFEEGADAVLAHIGGDGDGIEWEGFEEGTGVLCRGIADISTFGIGDGKMRLWDVVDRSFHRFPTFDPVGLIKGGVDLVGDAMVFGRVNDLAVEFKDRVFDITQMWGDLSRVGIEPNAEIGAGVTDERGELLTRHVDLVIF